MFRFNFDAGRHLITVVRSGFTPIEEVENFERELDLTIRKAKATGKRFDILIDSSSAEVLPRQVSDAVSRILQTLSGARIGKVAVVSTSALAAMQRQRLVGETVVSRTFPDTSSALAWINDHSSSDQLDRGGEGPLP